LQSKAAKPLNASGIMLVDGEALLYFNLLHERSNVGQR
jgi:hypothetical protein